MKGRSRMSRLKVYWPDDNSHDTGDLAVQSEIPILRFPTAQRFSHSSRPARRGVIQRAQALLQIGPARIAASPSSNPSNSMTPWPTATTSQSPEPRP